MSLIGEYVPLKKAGRDFKGLCPFHHEKSPSFMVSEEKQVYHCFGCGEGGDAIRFLMKRDGCTFPEAVEKLAERTGVELPAATPEGGERAAREAAHAQRLRALCARVATFYHERLRDKETGKLARRYLISRGFKDPAFLTQHFLGAADDEWESLVRYLSTTKDTTVDTTTTFNDALELGLIKRRPRGDGHYDFFRGRLMFPLRDAKNNVIGFGGRTLPRVASAAQSVDAPTSAKSDDFGPKYLNSSDSPIFHKSQTLYGFPFAIEAIRKKDRAIIVEGNFDVLQMHAHGFAETVAPLGTALTIDHFRLLRRYTHNIWIAFDGDNAGLQAARRALLPALDLELIPRALILPSGDDPDTWVATRTTDDVETALTTAPTLFEWVIDDTITRCGDSTVGRVRSISLLRPYFAQLRDPIQEATYHERIAQQIGVESAAVAKAFASDARTIATSLPRRTTAQSAQSRTNAAHTATATTSTANPTNTGASGASPAEPPPALLPKFERELLALVLQQPSLVGEFIRQMNLDDFTHPDARAIAQKIASAVELRGDLDVASLIADLAADDTGETLVKRISELAFARGTYQDADHLHLMLTDLTTRLRTRAWRVKQRELTQAIAAAEHAPAENNPLELLAHKHQTLQTRNV